MSRKYLIAGNWKMNKTASEAAVLVQQMHTSVGSQSTVQVAVCPPFTSMGKVSEELEGSHIALGAQNMHHETSGAYTGEVSAEMLRDFYVTYIILGHSERRQYFGETNKSVNKKILSTVAGNLKPIYCIGETLEQREANETLDVVRTQIREGLQNFSDSEVENLVIAYEPVWAIGTGKTATDEMAQEVHSFIRKILAELFGENAANTIRILYGGSMNAGNASGLLAQPDVDGGLIGGASLTPKSFCEIVQAALDLEA
jgi:triosephosphate isomerase